jgi:curli production assembly/transport component CsgF
MNFFRSIGLVLIALFAFSTITSAQDFVYTPKNPAFGGNYLNYQWMLSSAKAQNKLEGDQQQGAGYSGLYDSDPVENFEQNLQRQFFNQLTNKVVSSYFGDGQGQQQLEEGSYEFGNYKVDVFSGDQGVNIHIVDFNKGSETTITLPYY